MSYANKILREKNRIENNENFSYYSSLSDKELKNLLNGYLTCSYYKADKYTKLVIKILKKNNFSEKEKKVLVLHLCEHEGDIG